MEKKNLVTGPTPKIKQNDKVLVKEKLTIAQQNALKNSHNKVTSSKKNTKQNQEEEQKIQPKTGLFVEKPSARFTNIKKNDPFATQQKLTTNSFAYIYNAGGLPCKIEHHSVKNKLKWNPEVILTELNLDPLLVTCMEGLIDDKHPYCFIAKQSIIDIITALLEAGEINKIFPLVPKLVWPLRNALSSSSLVVVENALDILVLLSNAVKEELNTHLKHLIKPLVKHQDKRNLKEKIFEALRTVDEHGGDEVYKTIKSAIPTYYK